MTREDAARGIWCKTDSICRAVNIALAMYRRIAFCSGMLGKVVGLLKDDKAPSFTGLFEREIDCPQLRCMFRNYFSSSVK